MYHEDNKQQHKLRTAPYIVHNQNETDMFIMEVWKGTVLLGKKIMRKGTPEKSNADEINKVKYDIGRAFGHFPNQTTMKFIDLYKDNNGFIYYWKWLDDVGNVKTLLS